MTGQKNKEVSMIIVINRHEEAEKVIRIERGAAMEIYIDESDYQNRPADFEVWESTMNVGSLQVSAPEIKITPMAANRVQIG